MGNVAIYSLVCKRLRRWGSLGFEAIHSIPLIDAGLVGGHAPLVVAHPVMVEAAEEIVGVLSLRAGFVEGLER